MKTPAAARKPRSARILEKRRQAKRQGWLKYIRQGEGEESDEKAMLEGCVFDIQRANHVVNFFKTYGVLTEGAWKNKPFDPLPWQIEWLTRGFGWIRFSKQWNQWVRRFRYMYLEVPKKSGKTPLVATLGNYLLFADSTDRQINQYLAATTRKQAERCLMHAIRAIKQREDLATVSIVRKLEGFHSVQYGDNEWQVLAADPASSDGINGHVLADELHRWVGHEFFNSLRWALASQPEGVFIGITTAGADMEGVCRTCHDKTIEVNSGRQSSQDWYGKIYAAEPTDDLHDESIWKKANPSLGTSKKHPIKLESFKADYQAAKADPSQWPAFCQLRLNIWRTATETWLPIELWDSGDAQRRKRKKRIDCYEEYDAESYDWTQSDSVLAFDGATTRDTSSAVFIFEHPAEDGCLLTLPFFWLPEARAVQLADRVPFEQWEKQGLIRLTPGDAVDFDFIFADLVRMIGQFDVREMYFDPLFQAEWLTQKIESETGCQRIEFPQTITNFSPAMKTAERMIYDQRLRHNGHPILTWQMGNVKAKSNANGDIRPVKQKHGDYRTIDGIVAMIMAVRNWLVIEADDYYDDNELEMF